jgi:hypothetical protein
MKTLAARLAGASMALAAAIWTSSGAQAQAPIGPNISFRIASNHSGLCWDIPGQQFAAGVQLQQFPCHALNNQLWTFETVSAAAGEATLIRSADPALCVGKSESNQVVLQSCDADAPGQQWIFDRSDPSGFWIQRIRSQQNSECIDVFGASLERQAALNTYQCHDGRNQQWLLLAAP